MSVLDTVHSQRRHVLASDGVNFEKLSEWQLARDVEFGNGKNGEQVISDINGQLTASDGTPFRFEKISDNKFGFIIKKDGADTVIPFSSDITGELALMLGSANKLARYLLDTSEAQTLFIKQKAFNTDTLCTCNVYGFSDRNSALDAVNNKTESKTGTLILSFSQKAMSSESQLLDVTNYNYIVIAPYSNTLNWISLGENSRLKNCIMAGKSYTNFAINTFSSNSIKVDIDVLPTNFMVEQMHIPEVATHANNQGGYGLNYADSVEKNILKTYTSTVNDDTIELNPINGKWIRMYSSYNTTNRMCEINLV